MPTPGPLELVIILVIALLILGPGKLPDVGAALGKSIREFRKASSDVQDAVKVDTSPIAPAAAPATPVAPAVAPPAAPAPASASAPAEPVAAAPVASEPTSGTN
jgi:TatA/E family protein of Tat protein translocase